MNVRYHTPDGTGETRTERNIRFKVADLNEDFDFPDHALYLWDWFYECLNGIRSIIDGVPIKITWQDLEAWKASTGHIATPAECAILRTMSDAWCEAMGDELANEQARRKAADATKKPAPKPRKPKG